MFTPFHETNDPYTCDSIGQPSIREIMQNPGRYNAKVSNLRENLLLAHCLKHCLKREDFKRKRQIAVNEKRKAIQRYLVLKLIF